MRRRQLALLGGSLIGMATLIPWVTVLSGRWLIIHSARQMLLLACAAPLMAYGAGRLGRGAPKLNPLVGILAFNTAVLGAQLPALVSATSRSLLLDATVQLVLWLGCLCLWWPVLTGSGLSQIAKIGYLLVAGVPPTIPGVVMAFARHPIYSGYALDDQQLAGLLLFGTAKFTLIGGTFLILWRMLSAEVEPPEDDDGGAARPDLPPAAPAWLQRLDDELPAEPAPLRPRVRVPAGIR